MCLSCTRGYEGCASRVPVGMVGYPSCTPVGMVGYPSCTPVGIERCTLVYTPVGMRGVPWYIHPCTPGGHTIPGYIAQYTLPGTPSMPTVHRLLVHHCPLTLRCRLLEPWAQPGRNPWVESLLASQDLKSVTDVGTLIRRVFRSPERKRMKDWIVLGETPYNPLWLGCCVQKPPLPDRSSDR